MSAPPPAKRAAGSSLSEAITWVIAQEERLEAWANDSGNTPDGRLWKAAELAHAKAARQWLVLVEKHMAEVVELIKQKQAAALHASGKARG